MGIIGLTRALSGTLGDEGVTINAVLASLTHTAMAEGVPESILNDSVGRQVIHRMAEPGDIAAAVVSVASDEAGWITGQSVLANGGNAVSI
jgi:3-oxoacyl-[acyl-carrier protein] reductase